AAPAPLRVAQSTVAKATPARKPARRAIQGRALRNGQNQNQLPEALTASCANTPARRAKDRSYPDIPVSSFQGNHNKSPP
ncbi:hypothetical protein A2U01_0095165, partial [Trifolium medium]|nr:hypothetical protein [Trifolium medium]